MMMVENVHWVESVHRYWFGELGREDWFAQNDSVDEEISGRFCKLHSRLSMEDISTLTADGRTALAAVIVLDQFSRNMFRKTARAFDYDGKALEVAKKAISSGFDTGMSEDEKLFLYMPFMHSEQLEDQETAVTLFEGLANPDALKFAIEHHDIIMRFGRFPHRNKVLGRESSAEEASFAEGHSGYGQ